MITDIEEWGKMLLTRKETAEAVEMDLADFNENEEYVKAWKRGRLITISTHKKKIITLASQGSGPAQTHLEKLRMEEKLERIRNAW